MWTVPRSASIRPIRVMIADDTEAIRRGVRQMLASYQESLEVAAEAPDGEAAVQKALEVCPDVVVMDVQMPKLSGLEATRRIKQALPQTAIIGFSLHADALIDRAMCEAGASAFLAKDRAWELPEVIQRLAGRAGLD